jgi:hypothetical protein
MRDIPIPLRAWEVLALLDGRKTQTRRLAWRDPHEGGPADGLERRPSPWRKVRPGDRLWVREAWRIDGAGARVPAKHCRGKRAVQYRADGYQPVTWMERSPIHMPRWASRLTLTVTDVRVQRLQEISEADACAEGAREAYGEPFDEGSAVTDRRRFQLLWNHLHGPGAWDTNPEVVALTFTVTKGNIDV